MILALDAAQLSIGFGAILGATGAIWGTYRGARKDRAQAVATVDAESAAGTAVLLGGWRDFRADTVKEIERLQDQIAALRVEFAAERAEFAAERAEWIADRARSKKDREAKQVRIDNLESKITILERRASG